MIKWYLSRFKSMSLMEIVFRVKQMLTARYEKIFCAGKSPGEVSYSLVNARFDYQNQSHRLLEEVVHVFGKDFDFSTVDTIDWHKDIFSGSRFPVSFAKSINIRHNENLSAKNVWEINRMQCLVNVSINYAHTKDQKYLEKFRQLLSSWIKSNPYLLGVNWYSNIEVNIRLIVWYFCWQLLDVKDIMDTNPEFKSFVNKEWVPCVYQHCKYSHNNPSKFSSSNNHLISEYAGLFVATSLWTFKESKKWNRIAKAGLEKEILRQHSASGVNKEEAAEYIQFITDFFLLSYVAGENANNPFSTKYQERLRSIFYYIHSFLDADNNFPQYGDEDDGKCILFDDLKGFNNFESLLVSGAIMFNDPLLKSKTNKIDNKNKVLFGAKAIETYENIKAGKANLTSALYSDEGHFIFRKQDADKEIYMHFDAAPLGYLSIAAHGHADSLSFMLHVDGQPVIVDSGTYTYHTEPEWRNYFIGTLAHNTIRINKQNQAKIAGPTLWLDHFNSEVIEVYKDEKAEKVKATHDGYAKMGIKHEREILFNKEENSFLVIDEITPKKSEEYLLELPLHLHPQMKLKKTGDTIVEVQNLAGKRNIRIEFDKSKDIEIVNGQTNPEILGWYSKSFMQKEPTNTILLSLRKSGYIKLETKINII